MGNFVKSSNDSHIEKIYGNNNKSDLLRAFNKNNIFDPKYSTMSSKDRRVPWDGQNDVSS